MYLAMNGGNVEKTKKGHTWYRIPYVELSFPMPKVYLMIMCVEEHKIFLKHIISIKIKINIRPTLGSKSGHYYIGFMRKLRIDIAGSWN